MGEGAAPVVEIEDLRIDFPTWRGAVHALSGVTLAIGVGEIVGLVGESGSGKSVTGMSLLRLLPKASTRIAGGRVALLGRDVNNAKEGELRRLRGKLASMVFQEPMSALNPTIRIGRQIVQVIRRHEHMTETKAARRAEELLTEMQVPDAARVVRNYPFELSGGMRQRVLLAMAFSCDPKLLIADEPTTALDVTVQAQILALLERLRGELGMAIIMITHDLGVVAQISEQIVVMYAGRIVEAADARRLFSAPQHPYTWGLLRSIPTLDSHRDVELVPIPGRPPSLIRRPSGCHFHPRCAYALPSHATIDPPLTDGGAPGHRAACLLDQAQRDAAWAELRAGRTPQQARVAAGIDKEVVEPTEVAG
jgi:oligopeptide/dipeptide ABC transporter ATP-binding protein